MLFVFSVLICLVMLVCFLLHVGKLSVDMVPNVDPVPFLLLPDDMQIADITQIKFSSQFRGYNVAEVDAVLLKLQKELVYQNSVIAKLEALRFSEKID